jgi:hypothetical protein
MVFGIVVAAGSSVFIAAPMLLFLQERIRGRAGPPLERRDLMKNHSGVMCCQNPHSGQTES